MKAQDYFVLHVITNTHMPKSVIGSTRGPTSITHITMLVAPTAKKEVQTVLYQFGKFLDILKYNCFKYC